MNFFRLLIALNKLKAINFLNYLFIIKDLEYYLDFIEYLYNYIYIYT